MIAIIDYNAGNLTSVARAVTHIGFECCVTNNIKTITAADRVIFPGVGAAGSAMQSLKKLGLANLITELFADGKPILGICLGTQIIMDQSQEDETQCLGIIQGSTKMFPDSTVLKIPQMGWNSLTIKQEHPLMQGIREQDEFYFVHAYYPCPQNPAHIIATTEYGINFASVIGFRNIVATQFHLEKSGRPGLMILKNFCEWQNC